MKKSEQNTIEILTHDWNPGAIPASQWISGKGRFATRRALPPYCQEVEAGDVGTLRGKARQSAKRAMKKAPKTRKLIVVTDWRSANRLLKAREAQRRTV